MHNGTTSRRLRAMALTVAVAALGCAGPEANEGAFELEGDLEVVVITYDDTSDTEYSLQTDDGARWNLEIAGSPALATGDRVWVSGHGTREHFVVDDHRILDEDEGAGVLNQGLTGNSVRTTDRIAVLLVHWSAPDSLTVDEMRRRVFTNSNATSVLYRDASYNLQALTGDVFGWFQVPAMTNCDYRTLATNARNAATSAGVNLSAYGQVMYYFPRSSQCGWSGLAFLGTPRSPARDSFYNGSSGCVVLAHELLHNHGARHARSYSCTNESGVRVPIAPAARCTFSEYGDPYDPMGGGCYHFSAYQKAAQGWFGGCNGVTTTSDSEFDIVPTALASNDVQAVRVPMSSSLCPSGMTSCYYYLEYRQPIGFDGSNPGAQVHQGVLLHVAPGVDFTGSSRPGDPYLLDLTPTSSNAFRDPALAVGGTFTDPSGIQITTVSRTSASARVRVTFPGGGSGSPVCIDGSTPGGTPPPPPPPPPTCGTGEREFEGGCYVLTGTSQSYDSARATCQARGAGWGLAEIGGAAENNFVASLIGTREHWLGGNDRTTEGRFAWQSGAAFWSGGLGGAVLPGAYAAFVSGEPNDAGGNSDCVRMIAGGGWRDVSCGSAYRAVCERR
jgi:hypothetical protein